MDISNGNSFQTPLSNSSLLSMLLMSLALQKHTPNTATTVKREYDFIIVGGGSAGSVVASRLSEIPCVTVLLLEAGGSPPLISEVPSLARFFISTNLSWPYMTSPQKYTGYGLNNNQLTFPAGKAIGGSSVIDGFVVLRGNKKNYDRWAAEGAKGWSYDEVLPYFKKMEDNRDPEYVANGFHAVGGPQTIHRPRYHAEFKDPLMQTLKSLGYEVVDPNAYRQTGVYDLQGFLRSGQRCSAAKAYLVPAENRTNLDILPNARVRKILIQHRRAVGVQFDFQGSTYEIRARNEVIVSAGTINTAQLLMLSGIGPKKELERFNIPLTADLPVGMNLQDHGGSLVNFLLRPGIPPVTAKLLNPVNVAQYIQSRTGPLAAAEFIQVLALLKNNVTRPKKDFPDHQLYFIEAQSELALQLNIKPEVYAQLYGPYEGRAIYFCVSQLLHPRSRGTVTLQSTDPYDPPLIDPNYLDDPKDMDDIVEGLKTCMRVGRHPLMKNVGSTPFQTLLPVCERFVGNEDSYLRCVARNLFLTLSHQVGTARMGDPHDPRTVVDPELRVLHVKGLRVVDASVMPIIPSGNTNIPTLMVAEKASDMIKSTIECHGYHAHTSNHENEWIGGEDLYTKYYSDQKTKFVNNEDHSQDFDRWIK